MAELKRILKRLIFWLGFLPILFVLVPLAFISRFFSRPIDVGLGPEPMINNVYHKLALLKYGYSAETFAMDRYHIGGEFDFDLSGQGFQQYRCYRLFLRAIFRYRCLYIYFNGGPLGWTQHRCFEGALYRLAGIKVVVMPYGADVQTLIRTPNLKTRHALLMDYPGVQKIHWCQREWQIKHWTQYASYVIAGCDWVDYLYHWDVLVPAHFSIDTNLIQPRAPRQKQPQSEVIVLHAPNHGFIKGTNHFVKAVEELRAEGLPVRLNLVQKASNVEILAALEQADIVADQLVIGWHGIFAVEAMALAKPVICYLRTDLLELFRFSGALEFDEKVPMVSATVATVKEQLRILVQDAKLRQELGQDGRRYVEKYHSLEAVGRVFDKANRQIGIVPTASGQFS